jgi:integrase/recombinase XerD
MELPNVLRYEEIDRFILSIDRLEDLLACRLMLFGGLRVAEAQEVTPKDMDSGSCSVFVRQGKGSKDRLAPLDIHTLSLALILAKEKEMAPEDKYFEKCKRSLQRHVGEIAKKAGIPSNVTAHTLRHTCATWQLDKGIPLEVVRGNLGHSDISTTQIDLHLNIRQRSRAYLDATRFGI